MTATFILCMALAVAQATGAATEKKLVEKTQKKGSGQTEDQPSSVPLMRVDKLDAFIAKPSPEGYVAEILLPNGTTKPVSLTTMDAALDQKLLDISLLEDPKDVPRKIVVRVKKKDMQARSYPLLLRFRHSNKPAENIVLLTIPAVALTPLPPKIVFRQRSLFWGWRVACWPEKCVATIPVSPADQRAWLTNLKPEPTPFLKDASGTTGTLSTAMSAPEYGPTTPPPTLTVMASADFKLGESIGGVRFTADQLEPAVVLPVSVVTRLSTLELIPVLAAGVLLGWMVRKALESRIAQRLVQVDVARLRDTIETRLKTHKDAKLGTALTEVRHEIDSGFNAKAPVLKANLEKWQAAFKSALETFESDKKRFVDDAGALHAVLNRTYRLPPSFSVPIADAKGRLAVLLTLPRNDVVGAEAQKAEIENGLTEALRDAAGPQDSSFKDMARAALAVLPLMTPTDATRVRGALEAIATDHAPVTAFVTSSQPTREMLQAMLESVHRTATPVRDLVNQIDGTLRRGVTALNTEMAELGYDAATAWKEWKSRAESTAGALNRGDWTSAALQAEARRDELVTLVRDLGRELKESAKRDLLADLTA
jgi:hypothetical protein